MSFDNKARTNCHSNPSERNDNSNRRRWFCGGRKPRSLFVNTSFDKVSVLRVTDKQYGNIMNFWGKAAAPKEPSPMQLELF
jgi:hypothetical protein